MSLDHKFTLQSLPDGDGFATGLSVGFLRDHLLSEKFSEDLLIQTEEKGEKGKLEHYCHKPSTYKVGFGADLAYIIASITEEVCILVYEKILEYNQQIVHLLRLLKHS